MKKIILLTATITYILCVQHSLLINGFLKYCRTITATGESDWDKDLIWMIALDEFATSEKTPNVAEIKEDTIECVCDEIVVGHFGISCCFDNELAPFIERSFVSSEKFTQYIQYAILRKGKSH